MPRASRRRGDSPSCPTVAPSSPSGRAGSARVPHRRGVAADRSACPPSWREGQGGLLDVAIDPEFVTNQLVYLSYAEAGTGGAGTAVARGKLTNDGLENVEVIWRQVPKVSGGNHFGSRLVFARDGTLFITTGERFEYRDSAQVPHQHARQGRAGQPRRHHPAGQSRSSSQKGALPEIWSYGHRNMQGATLHPETGQLWTIEHGAQGGDELNLDLAGKNYGWPVITWGIDYSGREDR